MSGTRWALVTRVIVYRVTIIVYQFRNLVYFTGCQIRRSFIKGGGGGGFRPIILEILVMRYGLKEKARTRPHVSKKMGPNTKILTKRGRALNWNH